MAISLTQKESRELWAEARHNGPQQLERELFEILREMPKQLGKGYLRDTEVHPEIWLTILDHEYHDDVLVQIPDWDHPLQFFVLVSGKVIDECGGQVGVHSPFKGRYFKIRQ